MSGQRIRRLGKNNIHHAWPHWVKDDKGNKALLSSTKEGKSPHNIRSKESKIKCQEKLQKCTEGKS